MDQAKLIIFGATFIVAVLAWLRNQDPFSPVKIYLAYSIFFYLGIYTSQVRWETLVSYASLIISIGLCLIFEPRSVGGRRVVSLQNPIRLYKLIWLLSIPGILVKIYFIYEAGGIFEYVSNLVFRVRDWAGQGYLIVWFEMLPALSLIYFISIITDQSRNWRRISGFVIHFVIFLSIGLITGSRSYIVITLLGMVMMYSYLVRRIRLIWIGAAVGFLIVVAGVIGAARNNFEMVGTGNFIEAAISGEQFESMQTRYGVIPLEIVFDTPGKPLLFGTTYLSLITNFIPRGIFPEKFDTGGIAFTKIYTDDQWEGLSNLATGAITEAIINFGEPVGIVVGILLNLIFLIIGCSLYRNILYNKKKKEITVFHFAVYFYFILGAARFSFAEFTDIFFSMFFYAFLPYGLLLLMMRNTKSGSSTYIVQT